MKRIKKEILRREVERWGEVLEGLSPMEIKDILIPREEIFLVFKKNRDIEQDVLEDSRKKVLWAVLPCQARALRLHDFNFLREPEDTLYKKRRDDTLVVVKCCTEPERFCFCTSLGHSPFDKEGDIRIYEKEEFYLAEPLTEKGRSLLQWEQYPDAGEDEIEEMKRREEDVKKKIEQFKLEFKGGELLKIFNHKVWEELSFPCLNCGACTFHCPTCYCFDIQDVDRTGWGYRERVWDSCMFSLYSLETSGHNPREDRHTRLRNRIMHKFSYYPISYGEYQCVGCGKCVEVCPTGFDIRKALISLREVLNE